MVLVPGFTKAMDQNEKERFIAQTIDEVAELVEHMLERELPPEDFSDHIRGMSPYAERNQME